ncbi:phage tail protein [Pseudomonas sp.]|uniref:phage tail protein n=1 Tax=Pseudomonas sp. TaxID=306 RepID=UPI001B2CE8D8|nr:phage tail protein [Pseudomonas sp.]MBO9552444.1 phage tail protein [Pseudomonas sp.]
MVDQTSQFYAILTNVGAAKQANADALGIAWKITQMGVGDANGSDPTPNATQTSLINEWRRAPLNQLKVDDKNSAIIIAEQVIPADVGGKWIREIALYDADGDMVAVANCAPTYKPLLSQGSGRTQVVRMNLVVSSASNVQLKIDPAVVLATREWVTEELARQDFKHSVLAATTVNIALSGLQTVDGVALTAGARVLVKSQTAAKDNGLYLVVASGAWTRCADADNSEKVTPGMLVLVERGTVNGDSAWQLVTDAPISLGVTALAYEMAFGRTGIAVGTYRSVSVDAYGRITAATNPNSVAGYGLTDVYTKTELDQALALKAPLASPVLTGVPTAPTRPRFTADTTLATTDFVQSRGMQFNTFAATSQAGTYAGTIAHIGGVVHFFGDAQMAYSVPNSVTTGASMGAVVRVQNWSSGRLQITPQGNDKLQEGSAYAASNSARTIPPDTYVDLLHIGSGIWIMHGSGVDYLKVPWNKLTNTFGYAFSPSGMLEQWGAVIMPAPIDTQQVNVTFPLAFPNACLNLQTSIGVGIVDYDASPDYRLCKQQIHAGQPTKVGFEGQAIMDNYPYHGRTVKWRAIGY